MLRIRSDERIYLKLLRHVRLEGHSVFVLPCLRDLAGFLEEEFLGAESLVARTGLEAFGGAVGEDLRGLGVVPEEGFEDPEQAAAGAAVFDRDHDNGVSDNGVGQ